LISMTQSLPAFQPILPQFPRLSDIWEFLDHCGLSGIREFWTVAGCQAYGSFGPLRAVRHTGVFGTIAGCQAYGSFGPLRAVRHTGVLDHYGLSGIREFSTIWGCHAYGRSGPLRAVKPTGNQGFSSKIFSQRELKLILHDVRSTEHRAIFSPVRHAGVLASWLSDIQEFWFLFPSCKFFGSSD
jgi:hypothetical protein